MTIGSPTWLTVSLASAYPVRDAADRFADVAGDHLTLPAAWLDQLGRPQHRIDDILIPGAATEVSGDHVGGLGPGRRRVVPQTRGDGGAEPRGAESALQGVA